jgi:hypothetical protein
MYELFQLPLFITYFKLKTTYPKVILGDLKYPNII